MPELTTTAFPATINPVDFVNILSSNAGSWLTPAERAALSQELTVAGNSQEARAAVLGKIVENASYKRGESNRAFVLMQYFGYLRRNPDDQPNSDFSGYNFWLSKLDQFGGNFVQAEMVRAFIESVEYRQRFGQP